MNCEIISLKTFKPAPLSVPLHFLKIGNKIRISQIAKVYN